MAEAVVIQPDRRFIQEVKAAGGGDLKQCFQCATCSAVCDLSDGEAPFPRKEMHWAQWGLKDRLFADPDVWLCHQCNECSKNCPRGARPGDVLAAVRMLVVRHFSAPRALAAWTARATFPLEASAVAAVLLAGALLLRAPVEAALGLAAHEEEFYAAFFPHWLLIGFFTLFTALAAGAAVLGITRFWRALRAQDETAGHYTPVLGVIPALFRAVSDIVMHRRFSQCPERSGRRLAHLGVFLGFVVLFLVTVWAVLDLYLMPLVGVDSAYPFELAHPVKLAANVGAAALIVGGVQLLLERRQPGPYTPATSRADRYFLWLLLGVGLTGVIIQGLRFAAGEAPATALRTTAYGLYFLHLVLVFQLLVLLPFTKFAHILYRTVAMVYAEHTGRHRQLSGRRA